MDAFKIEFDCSAEQDIDSQVEFYENLAQGLGQRFRMAIDGHLTTLQMMPQMQIRYDDVRCVPIIGYPFMLHYSIIADKNIVRVHALIHTSRNPSDNWNKDDWRVSDIMAFYGAHSYEMEYSYVA